MNSILSGLREESVPENINNLGKALRELLSKSGINILKDFREVEKYLLEKNIENVLIVQTRLVLQEGNIERYFSQISTGITMTDVNNIVLCTQRRTGLNKIVVKNILTAILYAVNLPTSIASVVIQKDEELIRQDKVLLAPDQYTQQKIETIKEAVESGQYSRLNNLTDEINLLSEAGVPIALYAKALCILKNENEMSADKAKIYFLEAAKAGCNHANAYLGDYFFENEIPDYTMALHYYTELGAVSLNRKRQENVKVILEGKKQSRKILIFSGILLGLQFVFNIFMALGKFNVKETTHGFAATMSIIMCLIVYCFQIFEYRKKAYNESRLLTIVMVFVFAFFTFTAMV